MTDKRAGRLFVVSGPSGSGKTTLVSRVKRLPGVYYSVSVTSRKPRPGEVDGRDYRFVSREKFEEMIRGGFFAEYAEVAGNLYGTPAAPLEDALSAGKRGLVDIDVQGAMQIKARFPQARLIFIEPPDMAELERRLRGRNTETEECIRHRLDLAKKEMEYASAYDFRVVNDDLARAARELQTILISEDD